MVNPSDLTVRTDHGALTWLLSFSFQNDLYRRWIAELEGYGNFNIVHRRGAWHTNTDAASRIITCDCKWELCSECPSYFKEVNKRLHDSDRDDSIVDESHKKPDCDSPILETFFEEIPVWIDTARLYHTFITTGIIRLPRQVKANKATI